MNSKSSSESVSKKDVSVQVGHSALTFCAKNGDDANAKLAKKTLEQVNKVGVQSAYEQMAKDCFKHPETGRQLSYSEMRAFYG